MDAPTGLGGNEVRLVAGDVEDNEDI